jgi:hypothetical protein
MDPATRVGNLTLLDSSSLQKSKSFPHMFLSVPGLPLPPWDTHPLRTHGPLGSSSLPCFVGLFWRLHVYLTVFSLFHTKHHLIVGMFGHKWGFWESQGLVRATRQKCKTMEVALPRWCSVGWKTILGDIHVNTAWSGI